MNYKEAYDYINSFTNFELVPGINYALNMDELTRVDMLMRLLGNPQSSFQSVVIAGTKGKGSVAAMVESALRTAGHKTGLYTSPHLHTFRERIRVGGEMISPDDMGRIVERIKAVVEKVEALGEPTLVPTTYELATAIAFLYFQEKGVEIAVLEVGLGGRLDAVNIARPVVSVITPISMDHTQVLGDTLAQIAEEKAGIIKTGGKVISAPQSEEAIRVIERVAFGKRAQLTVVTQTVYVSTHHLPEVVSDEEGVPIYQVFSLAYEAEGEAPAGRVRLKLPLLGNHQQVNAAVAMAALRTLDAAGVKVHQKAIADGFAKVEWPGRLEIVRRNPVVVVDGAHNVESMSKLNQAMYDLFYRRKLIVVLGLSRDKDIEGIIDELGTGGGVALGPRVEKVIVTRSSHPRAAHPTKVAKAARDRGLYVEVREEVPEALATAAGIARAASIGDGNDPVVLVTGSLFIVAEAREHYGLAPDLSVESSKKSENRSQKSEAR
jgi:dihydrofolate synthase / folylpolyglutamate synthase